MEQKLKNSGREIGSIRKSKRPQATAPKFLIEGKQIYNTEKTKHDVQEWSERKKNTETKPSNEATATIWYIDWSDKTGQPKLRSPSNFKIPNVFNYLFNIKTFLPLSSHASPSISSSMSLYLVFTNCCFGCSLFVLVPISGTMYRTHLKRNTQYNKLRDRFRRCLCYLRAKSWLLLVHRKRNTLAHTIVVENADFSTQKLRTKADSKKRERENFIFLIILKWRKRSNLFRTRTNSLLVLWGWSFFLFWILVRLSNKVKITDNWKHEKLDADLIIIKENWKKCNFSSRKCVGCWQ